MQRHLRGRVSTAIAVCRFLLLGGLANAVAQSEQRQHPTETVSLHVEGMT